MRVNVLCVRCALEQSPWTHTWVTPTILPPASGVTPLPVGNAVAMPKKAAAPDADAPDLGKGGKARAQKEASAAAKAADAAARSAATEAASWEDGANARAS